MSSRTRHWMRLARLLVACIAFFVARPAAAAPVLDAIVLVAGSEVAGARAAAQPTEHRASAERAAPAPTRRPQDLPLDRARLARSDGIDGNRAPGVPLVRVPETYLRNCSLLC
jgi:hypothetical protein